MKKNVAISLLFSLLASTAAAQFTGPSTTGKATSVAQVSAVRPGSYVSVTGNIVAHQREKYYTFRDETGEIRVEIESSVWQNRQIGPEIKVRLLGEVEQGSSGRYLSVKSLDVVK